MKKYIAAIAIALFAVGSSVPASAAANVAVAGPGAAVYGEFVTPRIVLTKSAPATFVNLDVAAHDIQSTKKCGTKFCFESDIINVGQTSPIKFASSVPAGDYGFICSLHDNMTGTATVV